MSPTAIVMPPRVAYSKPTLLIPSTTWAVSAGPSIAVALVDELAQRRSRFMVVVLEAERDPAGSG